MKETMLNRYTLVNSNLKKEKERKKTTTTTTKFQDKYERDDGESVCFRFGSNIFSSEDVFLSVLRHH